MTDVNSRLYLAIRLGRRCKAKDVVSVLAELTRLYPAPVLIRSENVPEFIAHALRRWCKHSAPQPLISIQAPCGRTVLPSRMSSARLRLQQTVQE